MPVITFWSNTKKQTGQTMSLTAISTSMAIEHNYKILIISTKYNDGALELCFGELNKNKSLVKKLISNPTVSVDNGIEGLAKMANSNRMTPDIIQNYTHVIFKNRLEILYGYKETNDKTSYEEYLKVKEKYKDIIQNANQYYDMVFVDLDKGLDEDMIKQVLKISDIIVTNVEQKVKSIDDFNELINSSDVIKSDNVILNVGRFDVFSKYSLKNISRYVGSKIKVTAVPYNTLFFEASGEENVADLFLKIRKVSDLDRNANFVKEVKEAVNKIIYKLQELQMRI
jgi:MinD-like ATPase involved in chromosome partitioning or flagellar assembly